MSKSVYINKNAKERETEKYLRSTRQFFAVLEELRAFLRTRKEAALSPETNNSLHNIKKDIRTLKEFQTRLYADILPARYGTSYGNPDYCAKKFGVRAGKALCFLYAELRAAIPCVYEGNAEGFRLRKRLLTDAKRLFAGTRDIGFRKFSDGLYGLLYEYAAKNDAAMREKRVRALLCGSPWEKTAVEGFAVKDAAAEYPDAKAAAAEVSLYLSGEYIAKETLDTAAYLNAQSEALLQRLADTLTDGFCRGFAATNKSLAGKETAGVRLPLGFAPLLPYIEKSLRERGLRMLLTRAAGNLFDGRDLRKRGFYGASPNRQYEYDHKDDLAFVWDRALAEERLHNLESTYRKHASAAAVYAGPLVLESFGEADFTPATTKHAIRYAKRQQALLTLYGHGVSEITERYFREENTSFTMLALPVPEIINGLHNTSIHANDAAGLHKLQQNSNIDLYKSEQNSDVALYKTKQSADIDLHKLEQNSDTGLHKFKQSIGNPVDACTCLENTGRTNSLHNTTSTAAALYDRIFRSIVEINTLDNESYRRIQQKLIDALDQAAYCLVRGMNGNRTRLKVRLRRLKDPARETLFENCVADVNIPAGEVFTSPVLRGTEGILHVRRVFLEGLEYRDLEIEIRDGMVRDYRLSNFPTEEENRRFFKENVLKFHDTLPMGEFAIGTNTTAYAAARKYGIEAKLPILIAEKTGPHFAFGDTCYAHAEELAMYNPDGKEVIARENECSALRRTAPRKAYFGCHTDITLPFDELGSLTAVCADNGAEIALIENGRFVLPGTEALNAPLASWGQV